MPNQYPPDRRPDCPECIRRGRDPRNQLSTTTATQCVDCRDEEVREGIAAGDKNAHRKPSKVRRLKPAPVVTHDTAEERQAIPKGMPFERAWDVWMREIGMAEDRYRGACARPLGTRQKVIGIGDLHIPFHNQGALARVLAEQPDADVCVIGGDFGDAHCASTFTKYEHVSYEEELAGKTAVLQTLSERYPRVLWLEGSNHPDRFEKRLRESLSRDLLAAVMDMTGGILNPDLALIKRFPNVEPFGWMTPTGDKVGWLGVLGDVAFTHAEKYSRLPGNALRGISEWLDDFSGTLGLPPLRAVCQFHTHMQGQFPFRSDMWLVEPGCLCQTMNYQLKSKIAGRPQRLGYVVMELEDDRLVEDTLRLRSAVPYTIAA